MNHLPKVLIVDEMHPGLTDLLTAAGFDPDYQPFITREQVLSMIQNYDGLVVRSKLMVNRELIDRAKKLKFVARAGAGLDQIDYPYLTEKGIAMVNAPEGNRDALGEHTVGMLLSILHKLHTANNEVRSGVWQREANRGFELHGKTVGIYGFGFMGSAFAEKLSGFGCRVIAYDKYKAKIANPQVEQVDLRTFQQETEILSLHIPLTPETRFLFDDAYLDQFKKLRLILNTSRGEVLKLSGLIRLLETGQLIGAGLDVLENEKLSALTESQQEDFKKLLTFPNVILTPHVAGWTMESYQRINEVLLGKIRKAGLTHVN